jgi:hypothetical protein
LSGVVPRRLRHGAMKGRELRVVCIFAGARLAEGAWPRDAPLAHMHSLTTATPQRERETETEREREREREREQDTFNDNELGKRNDSARKAGKEREREEA